MEHPVGHVFGCLDVDHDGMGFWAGLYESVSVCRLYHYPSLTPPFGEPDVIDLPWLPDDRGPDGQPMNPYGGMLDGLAVAEDGTLWISSDVSRRVYHVARDGTRLGSFDMDFVVSGHEYLEGYLWLMEYRWGQSVRLRKVDLQGNILAYFTVPTPLIEDLDVRASEGKVLRGLDAYGNVYTWRLDNLELVQP